MTLTTKRKPSATTHKKRVGQHRQHGRNYLKPYWPYLPLIAIVSVGLAINSFWSHQKSVLGYATDMSSQTLLRSTNAARTNHRDKPLQVNIKLAQAAQAKANDMAKRNYWAHNTPAGKTPWSFITQAGYTYQRAGENLAYGFSDASSTITGWINSPEHRANLLNPYYSQVGFGVANIPNYNHSGPETLVVAMYAEPAPMKVTLASAPVLSAHTSPSPKNISIEPIQEPSTQNVARVQLITSGNAPWSMFVISAIATLAALTFVLRHGFFWRRVFTKGEAFVISHPYLDILIVTIITLSFILSRTTGVIR